MLPLLMGPAVPDAESSDPVPSVPADEDVPEAEEVPPSSSEVEPTPPHVVNPAVVGTTRDQDETVSPPRI